MSILPLGSAPVAETSVPLRIVEAVLFRTRYTVACADEAFPAVIADWSMPTVIAVVPVAEIGDVPTTPVTYVPAVWYEASRMTLTVPPEMAVDIGEIPTTEVSPLVDAGVKMTPPVPSAARRYPFGLVPEFMATVAELPTTVAEIGVVPTSDEIPPPAEASKATPPAPSAVSTKPSEAVPDEMEIVAVPLEVDTVAGEEPTTALT
jgi:hypothetical protein